MDGHHTYHTPLIPSHTYIKHTQSHKRHTYARTSVAIKMTDRLVLQRLESYQSDAGGADGSLNQPPSSSSPSIKNSKRSLFAQFSLIGDNNDDEEDTSIEENLTNQARRKGCWMIWYIIMHYKRLGSAIVLFLCMAIFIWVSTKNKHTDIKEHNDMSCPIQSSYSVSSDIMNLKNSSTGEYLYMHCILSYHPTL